jgi:phage head maturation protease
MDTRAATHFWLRHGQAPWHLVGRLLTDRDSMGREVMLDPVTAGEMRDDRPAFILSTEGEATDGHVVRQYWDLDRAKSVGVPVLWSHDAGQLLGQWEDLAARDLPSGRALVGRARLSATKAQAIEAREMIREGILRAVSVGWRPGRMVRRGELDPGDPLYRSPEDGDCGEAREGSVMGTPDEPNELVEGSLCSTPADPRAMVTSRIIDSAARSAGALTSGGAVPTGADALTRLYRLASADPTVRAYLGSQAIRATEPGMNDLARRLAAIEARLATQTTAPSVAPDPSLLSIDHILRS